MTTEPTAAQYRDALSAVLDALAIPHAGSMGEQAKRDRILVERAGHTVAMLQNILTEGAIGDVPWAVAYLRARLAEHPAEGYKTWDERIRELGIGR